MYIDEEIVFVQICFPSNHAVQHVNVKWYQSDRQKKEGGSVPAVLSIEKKVFTTYCHRKNEMIFDTCR